MTQTKTLTARNPGDLLALVPYLLGFHPTDSVVLITLGEARRPFHARVDLPPGPDEVPELADYLATVAVQHGLRRVVLVVYCHDEERAAGVAGPVVERLEEKGLRVPVAIRADGQRWFCLGPCPGECPPDGTPYDVTAHPFTAQAVVEGRVMYRSREELRDSLVGSDPAEVEAVGRAADAALERFRAAGQASGRPTADQARAHLVGEGRWVGHRVREFLSRRTTLSSEEVGRLLVALVSIEVRDVAWAEMTHDNAAGHVDLWRDVVRRAPLDLLAAPAALLGFAAWLSGDGALAWCAVDRCRQAEPGYSLAGLLADALAGAVPPSSWRPLGPDSLTLFAG